MTNFSLEPHFDQTKWFAKVVQHLVYLCQNLDCLHQNLDCLRQNLDCLHQNLDLCFMSEPQMVTRLFLI